MDINLRPEIQKELVTRAKYLGMPIKVLAEKVLTAWLSIDVPIGQGKLAENSIKELM